jgi:hypothetical protein
MKSRSFIVVAVVLAMGGCDSSLQPQPVVQQPFGEAPQACDAAVVFEPRCVGRCCPKAPECYPGGKNPSEYSGAECLAARDNTGQARRQYRQTISVSTAPQGFASPLIGDTLVPASSLQSEACGTPDGVSGFIQLIDFDHANGTSRVGFAKVAPALSIAAQQGLCLVEDVYDDVPRRLGALPIPANWPAGLPPPMPLPWNMKIVTSIRLAEDFDLSASRTQILARFAEGGDLFGKFNGVFYFNEEIGYMHGFSPLAYILNYSPKGWYNAIPLREAEIKQRLNEPTHPNCAGAFLGDNPLLPATCLGSSTNRLWGCPKGTCSKEELGPTSVRGYFLLTELEQVFHPELQQSLCNFIPGGPHTGWTSTQTCRSDPKWNPADPERGLPPGDWCAATNSKADARCHDAWQSVSYSTFQAFKIQDGVCPAQ